MLFGLGAAIATLTAIALLTPAGPLEPMWRLNPPAHAAFLGMGGWAVALMAIVAIACAIGAVGLWRRERWGYRLAVVFLAINIVSDIGNGIVRGDWRTMIGVPIAGAVLVYLLQRKVRESAWR